MSRENFKLLLVAAFCLTVAWTGPAIAHGVNHALFAHNADKVDGKHAVISTATASERKGKLVATDATTGLLPNNIIAKALDAEKLDGLDSTAFLPASGKAADADKLDGLDSADLQRRITGCAVGTAITAVSADGAPTCASFLPSNGTAMNALAVGGRSVNALRSIVATASAVGTFEQPVSLSPSSPTQLVAVTLTVPQAGTVQVDGVTTLMINRPNATHSTDAQVGISRSDQTATVDHPGAAYWFLASQTPLGLHADTFPATRTFNVNAGTYTFRVMAQGSEPTRMRSAVVNARFTPN